MRLVADRNVLLGALVKAGRAAVSGGGYLPILAGVRITGGRDAVSVVGTNLDTTITASFMPDSQSEQPFDAVIPARVLTDMVKGLPSDATVTLTADPMEESLTVDAGRFVASLRTLPVDDWPHVDTTPDTTPVTLDRTALSDAIASVVLAASTDDARPILTGIYIDRPTTGGVRLVATDSYRLAYRDLPGVSWPGEDTALIPASATREVERLIADDNIEVLIDDRTALFRDDTVSVSTRLLTGDYPNYGGLIPDGMPHTLTVPAVELAEVVGRVQLMAREPNTPIKLTLDDGQVTVSAATQGVGDATETVDGATYDGEPMVTAFNPRYLLDGLDVAGAGDVTIGFDTPHKPATITTNNDGWLYLLMPVRL